MKKITKVLVLVFILMGTNLIEAYSSIIITIKIARHRDCKGLGWCKWTIQVENDGSSESRGTAVADINDSGNLLLTINKKKDLTPEAYETYFSKGVFICEDDFPVPSEVLKALNYSGPYTIKAGNYPIVKRGDILTIEF